MKKIYSLLLLLPLISAFGGCSDLDEIIFDHEKQEFPIKENAILLEVIMPTGSVADDEYYIVGDFNGGEEAIGKLEWKLEKAANSSIKWGIYLVPSSFQDGKTLADGFTFHAKRQGAERSIANQPVLHTLDVQVGSFTNVWVDRWESYFGEVVKDSYSIYVNDQTGWDELSLYAWGDDGDVTPGWPGLLPTGTEVINGVTYTVFDMGEERKDVTMNLIFNNNNNGKQFDALQGFTLNRDVYLLITESGYEEVDPNVTPYAGYTVYVDNQTGWDELALYAWGDGEPAGWPGLQPTGTKEIEGVTYTYFEMGEEMNDLSLNLIFNNNGNNVQLGDIPVLLDRDYYFQITESGGVEIDPEGGAAPSGYRIYIDDQSEWDAVALHYWGDGVTGTDWPGLNPAGTEEVGGITFTYFQLPEELNEMEISTIFNNQDAGAQFDGPYIKIDRDYYFTITAAEATQIDPESGEEGYKLYVEDNTEWDAVALHYWGDGVTGTEWPGIAPVGSEEVNDVSYLVFQLPAALNGKHINTIFNNNGGGVQFDGPYILIENDYYFQITEDSFKEVTP